MSSRPRICGVCERQFLSVLSFAKKKKKGSLVTAHQEVRRHHNQPKDHGTQRDSDEAHMKFRLRHYLNTMLL